MIYAKDPHLLKVQLQWLPTGKITFNVPDNGQGFNTIIP